MFFTTFCPYVIIFVCVYLQNIYTYLKMFRAAHNFITWKQPLIRALLAGLSTDSRCTSFQQRGWIFIAFKMFIKSQFQI